MRSTCCSTIRLMNAVDLLPERTQITFGGAPYKELRCSKSESFVMIMKSFSLA